MKKFYLLVPAFLLLSLHLFAQSSTRLYVDSSRAASGNGSSWEDAVKTLNEALDAANSNSTIKEIWVAKGTYYPDEGPGRTNNDRNASFSMKNGVAIYGGFARGQSSLNMRDWKANPTILSGEIQQDNYVDNNASTVIYTIRLNSTALLDGFSITRGEEDSRGGGMYNEKSSPTLANCTFLQNRAKEGGGMYNLESSPSLMNCSFFLNWVAADGGGICNNYSSPSLVNCTFSSNRAGIDGGGMSNFTSFPSLVNCTFLQNTAVRLGGGISNFKDPLSTFLLEPTLVNCILWGNTSGQMGNTLSQISNYYSTATVTYSLVQGRYDGAGNIDADPLYVNPANPAGPDGIFGTADDGLKLRQGSQAVNKGSNAAVPPTITTDITGAARIQQEVVDMGAYEGAVCPTWYQDTDKDGYGNLFVTQISCSQADGYVADNTDCDDTNAAIHHGATEIADDGIDQDCDGFDQKTFYRDGDGDGFGNKADTLHRNTQPPGYVTNNTDCKDDDKTIYPGASELCDGKDNDCDGQTDEDKPVVNAGADKTVYNTGSATYSGYPACATLTASVSGGKAPYTYKWLTGVTSQSVQVCPKVTTTYTVTVTDGKGCTGSDAVVVRVTDVRCGSKLEKITVCHQGKNTLCIGKEGVADHLKHGDYLGSCTIKSLTAARAVNDAIIEAEEAGSLRVSATPNPSVNYFTLSISSANTIDKISIRVTDATGRIVEIKSLSVGQTLRFGDTYLPGIYLIQIMQGKNVKTIKLIKRAS